MNYSHAEEMATSVFRRETSRIPMRSSFVVQRDRARASIEVRMKIGWRDGLRQTVDTAAFLMGGRTVLSDIVGRTINHAWYVNDCREAIRDLVDP